MVAQAKAAAMNVVAQQAPTPSPPAPAQAAEKIVNVMNSAKNINDIKKML